MSAPRISVIVPTRDRIPALALCLARLAPGQQSVAFGQYEVIVTDDSATDTARVFLAERFSWVRWSVGPRRGPASNRNSGAGLARGDILVFVDDDCLPDAGLLAGYLDALTDDVSVYEGRITCVDQVTSPMQTVPENLDGGVLWSCNLAMRRQLFDAIGGFDERFPLAHMEDIDLRERLVAAGEAIRFVPRATVDHPPRRLPWGARLARQHQAGVFYMALHPPMRSLAWFLQNSFRARVSRVVHMRISLDSLLALTSVPVELVAIAWHWRGWKRWARAQAMRPR